MSDKIHLCYSSLITYHSSIIHHLMNISYNWLCELVRITLAPGDLAERLTRVGLAVEAVHQIGSGNRGNGNNGDKANGSKDGEDDYILEVDLTSNRPDCLSHLGVAREIAAITGEHVTAPRLTLLPSHVLPSAVAIKDLVSVEVQNANLCPRYTTRVVRGVRVGPSPGWLARRLEIIGQRSINNVADITNYVMHEQGQPLHAFDLAKLNRQKVVVRLAQDGERIKTLDGIERELKGEMLVIADASQPVAVAGVMGSEASAVYAATTEVLIESAYFDALSVRRTASELGLHTEASHRFERGVNYDGVLRAQQRAINLICEIAGGTATEDAIDVYPQPLQPPMVNLRFGRVKELTGIDVAPEEMVRILTALGFAPQSEMVSGQVGEGKANSLPSSEANCLLSIGAAQAFKAPPWRIDIGIEEDLVEEVTRYVGYDKIAAMLPAGQAVGEYQRSEGKKRGVRAVLSAYGFSEAINYSFIDSAHDEQFELLAELTNGNATYERQMLIGLRNPIVEGAARMRPTLLPGLLDAVRRNFNHGTRDVMLFEIGRTFTMETAKSGEALLTEQEALPAEREALALVATGGYREEQRALPSRDLDFYDVKGALEAAAERMNIGKLVFVATKAKHLPAGQAASVSLDGRVVGTLGRLAEAVASIYKFGEQPVYVAEIDLSVFYSSGEVSAVYTPLPRYPAIVRDVSLLATPDVSWAFIQREVEEMREENCRRAELIGIYEGANIPEGMRSVTMRIEYRSDERTLRDEEVEEMHGRIVSNLQQAVERPA